MLSYPTRILNRLWTTPPRDAVRLIGKRLSKRRNTGYDPEEVMNHRKFMRTQMLYDFLSRYETIIRRSHADWQPLEFNGKRILEMGCGPVMGWGPLTVFLGCVSHTGVEPKFNASILQHPEFEKRYLLPLYRDLRAVYGPRMEFAEFKVAVRERITIVPLTYLEAGLSGPFDVMLSNSVLEHIFPLKDSIVQMKRHAAPGCRFLHLVDFGNHRQSYHPLAGIYEREPEEYFQKFGRLINLHRSPDVLGFFNEAGWRCRREPYYFAREYFNDEIIPYWRDRYDDDSLFMHVAIFFGDAP